MYQKPSKRTQALRRSLTITFMSLAVVLIVSAIVLSILGYRFDSNNGSLEQGALLQFASEPSGATVEVDGKAAVNKTPTKFSVMAGTHTFTMRRDGYEVWTKTIDVKAGTLNWLNYALLIPTERTPEKLTQFTGLSASLASPDSRAIAVLSDAKNPSIELIDIRSDDIKTVTLTLPQTLYTDALTPNISHAFTLNSWDQGGRYILMNHTYNDKSEWLIVDTRDINNSKNVTKLLNIDITSPVLAGTSGSIVYVISAGDIRKLDLSAATISRSLVSGVKSFELYDTNILTYVGVDQKDPTRHVAGLYREGDSASHILRSSPLTTPLSVATARYFNQDFVAIAEGTQIDILGGSYPTTPGDDISSLGIVSSVTFEPTAQRLSFSPRGDYVLAQTGATFMSYDIEHSRVSRSTIVPPQEAPVGALQWLNDDHVWSDTNSTLTIRDFDGANVVSLSGVTAGQDVVLTTNRKFMYSFNATEIGFSLQRVRLALP